MALLTSQGVSSQAVGLLSRQIVLPNTVTRIPGEEFAGANGDTITVRTSTPGASREQVTPGATITYDALNEVGVNVTLRHLYNATRITDEMLTYELDNFGAQVTSVQVDAVARGAEDLLAAAMNGLASEDTLALTASNDDTMDTIIAAAEALDTANVPPGDRFLAVSPGVKSRLIKILDNAGDTASTGALRQATVGEVYGFTVVTSNALTAGTAVAYHRSGFVFANRAPVTPRGANDSSTATFGGVSLRHIFQYQPDILSDASVVSTFAGAAVVDAARVWKITTSAT